MEDPPLVNLAAPRTLRKVRRTNRILAIVFSSNYNLLSDAVRPPQVLLSKAICSSHSLLASSLSLKIPRCRGPLEVLTPSCGVPAVLLSCCFLHLTNWQCGNMKAASDSPGLSKPNIFSVPHEQNNTKPEEITLVNLTASLALKKKRRANSLIFTNVSKHEGNATPP